MSKVIPLGRIDNSISPRPGIRVQKRHHSRFSVTSVGARRVCAQLVPNSSALRGNPGPPGPRTDVLLLTRMDEGETLLKAGDWLVQRGTKHALSNRTDKP
jgi:hypothetical protein